MKFTKKKNQTNKQKTHTIFFFFFTKADHY